MRSPLSFLYLLALMLLISLQELSYSYLTVLLLGSASITCPFCNSSLSPSSQLALLSEVAATVALFYPNKLPLLAKSDEDPVLLKLKIEPLVKRLVEGGNRAVAVGLISFALDAAFPDALFKPNSDCAWLIGGLSFLSFDGLLNRLTNVFSPLNRPIPCELPNRLKPKILPGGAIGFTSGIAACLSCAVGSYFLSVASPCIFRDTFEDVFTSELSAERANLNILNGIKVTFGQPCWGRWLMILLWVFPSPRRYVHRYHRVLLSSQNGESLLLQLSQMGNDEMNIQIGIQ